VDDDYVVDIEKGSCLFNTRKTRMFLRKKLVCFPKIQFEIEKAIDPRLVDIQYYG
jgi:hypothetical protein